MSAVSKTVARHRLLRNAAMIAVLIPVGLLAACADQPPPPPPQPVVVAPPPPPPPAPVPPARG
jgi:hypothetical protein